MAEEAKITDFQSAVSALSGELKGERRPAVVEQESRLSSRRTPAPAAVEEEEEVAEAPEPEESEAVAESDGDDDVELPDSLDELAEALGVDPSKLSGLKVKRNVGGKIETVTLAEAIEQHQLHADYTRKSQAVAEERKAVEAKYSKQQEELGQRIKALDDAIVASWTYLQQLGLSDEQIELIGQREGFEAAYRAEKKRDAIARKINETIEVRRRAEAELTQKRQEAEVAAADEFRKKNLDALYASKPELRDPSKLYEFEHRILGYMTESVGFTRDEVVSWLSGPWDHRQIVLAEKAMKYDELLKQGKQAKTGSATKVIKPGAVDPSKKASQAARNSDALRNKLRRASGRVNQVNAARDLVASMLK